MFHFIISFDTCTVICCHEKSEKTFTIDKGTCDMSANGTLSNTSLLCFFCNLDICEFIQINKATEECLAMPWVIHALSDHTDDKIKRG